MCRYLEKSMKGETKLLLGRSSSLLQATLENCQRRNPTRALFLFIQRTNYQPANICRLRIFSRHECYCFFLNYPYFTIMSNVTFACGFTFQVLLKTFNIWRVI